MTMGLPDLGDLADRVVAFARDCVAPAALGARVEANVLASRTRHGLTRFANSFIHQHVGEDTVTVLLTVAVDGRTATASTTATDDDALRALVDRTIASAALQPVDPQWPGATPPVEVIGVGNFDEPTASATPEARAALVRSFVDAGPELLAAGYVDTEADWVAFSSTAGQRASGATSRASVDGIHQTGSSAGSGHQTSLRVGDLDAGAVGDRAADRARRSAQFVDIPPGDYEVVLGPEAVSTMLEFLTIYGFNAKTHLDGFSFARIGEQQFDASITLMEDPTDPRAIGLPFDAEGSPRRRFALVEQGVTRALAHDRRTAARAGTTTTGNAIPGGTEFGAIPTNLVLSGGDTSPDDLVGEVERGLLVTQFHYVRILDSKTTISTGLTRNGTFLIEDGKVAGAVGNLRFTQSFLDALGPGRVSAIGDDQRHAASDIGGSAVICPSLRLAGWSFTGGAKG